MNIQDLNFSQKKAVKITDGPLLILAGAGTGKTRVLINKIAHIINKNLASPREILAVTFSNKAANEMGKRIKSIITSPDGFNIGTFHSFCAKILRFHIHLLNNGMNQNFHIIDQDEQLKIVRDIVLEINIDIRKFPPKLFHTIISKWKDQGLIPEQVNSFDGEIYKLNIVRDIYQKYQKILQKFNVADFSDLLLYCNQLFSNNLEILRHYQEKFKYILIDEYQDTNFAQYTWAKMLANNHKNICCVGDDDQSIYSWRGAEIKNILFFQKDFPNVKVIKLEQNYRSAPHILEAASSIIKNNKNRHDKVLWTTKKSQEKLKIISCLNEKEEGKFIASQVEKYIYSKKYSLDQIAVLVRAGFQTRAFEEAFITKAIPYQIIGGLRFYERREIKDLIAYIRLSINKDDNLAFERVINVPKRSIGNLTLKKIMDKSNNYLLSAFCALEKILQNNEVKGKTKIKLQDFITLINEASLSYKSESAFKVTEFILKKSGYLASLKEAKTEESKNRIDNINEMLKVIDEIGNINKFIEHASLLMDNDLSELDSPGKVKIMTLHASKGLEFDAVFLPGWEEGIFPYPKSLLEKGALEEERRIAYVGITRAKKELFISYAETRRIFAEILSSVPSRFLLEIPHQICQKFSFSDYLEIKYTNNTNTSFFHKKNNFSNTKCDKKVCGNMVNHDKFGSGIVIRKNNDTLDIIFKNFGLKTIKQSYVKFI